MLRYFVFEGIDTTGKTTLCAMLKEKLLGIDFFEFIQKPSVEWQNNIFIQEPAQTQLAKTIKALILEKNITQYKSVEFFLYVSQRMEIVESIATCPHFKTSQCTLISDRSFISGVAYANATTFQNPINYMIKTHLLACKELLPKKIVLLTLSEKVLHKRLMSKTQQLDSIESMGATYLLDIQCRYFQVIEILKKVANDLSLEIPEVLYIDSSQDINKIYNDVYNFLFPVKKFQYKD